MAWRTSLLVVANRTLASDELHAALLERSRHGPISVTLLAPADQEGLDPHAAREATRGRLDAAVARLQVEGIPVEGVLGDRDPVVAVHETWDPRRYDEVVVSTLSADASKWLQLDLPHRIERMTGAPVRHVVAAGPPRQPGTAPPAHEKLGLVSPLSVLGWGGRQRPGSRGLRSRGEPSAKRSGSGGRPA